MRILIVDDLELNRTILSRILNQAGYEEVSLAGSAEEMFSILKSPLGASVHLILLDLVLPGIDGIQACKTVKKNPVWSDIPVIMITAESDMDLLTEAFTSGALDYIMRPVNRHELLARVRAAIQLFQEMSSRRQREAELIESEKKFRQFYEAAFKATSEGIIIHDKGVILDANESFSRLAGLPLTQILNRQVDYFIENKDNSQDIHAVLCVTDSVSELLIKRADGTIFPAEVSSKQIPFGKSTAYVSAIRDITERKRNEEELLYNSFHDNLTGLANRSLFVDRLQSASARARQSGKIEFCVLLLNIARFRIINEVMGHLAGDELLKLMANRLTLVLRPGDTGARLAGDEFAILAENIYNEQSIEDYAKKIQEALTKPTEIRGQLVYPEIYIGIVFPDSVLVKPDLIMRQATVALQKAKGISKDNLVFYRSGMDVHADKRLSLESDIRRAFDAGEFLLYYQPIYSFHDNRVSGFEALARWQHPVRGMVSPIEFIPLAEETGLIEKMGDMFIAMVCQELAQWRNLGYDNLNIAVNISGRQFRREDFSKNIFSCLQNANVPPQSLKIEITESVAMTNVENTLKNLQALAGAGISISIDDFGTGYSSLGYLKRFPIHTLKIDRSFIIDITTDKDDQAIVKAIIALARSLGLNTICEGIENTEQLLFCREIGCDEVQGYLISRPLPADKVPEFLASYKRHIPLYV